MASSSDEGEIIEGGVEDLKATSLPRHPDRSGVDRQDRHRSRQSTPDYDAASRHSNSSRRSRSPRGFKRSHDERDHYGRDWDRDQRRQRSHYDDSHSDGHRRARAPYEDLDRPNSRPANNTYDARDRENGIDRERGRDHGHRDSGRDRFADRGNSNRSSPPYRPRRGDARVTDRFVREEHAGHRRHDDPTGLRYDDDRGSQKRRPSPTRRAAENHSHTSNQNAKSARSTEYRLDNDQSGRSAREPEPEQDYEEPELIDEDAEIERRRKRREELLSRSKPATPLLLHAVGAAEKVGGGSPMNSQPSTPQRSQLDTALSQSPLTASPRSPGSHDEPSPGAINLLNDKELMNSHGGAEADDEDGPSAADYDPTVDMKEDERRDELRYGQVVLHGESHVLESTENHEHEERQETTADKKTKPADNADDFDMFAENFDEEKFAPKPTKTAVAIETNNSTPGAPDDSKGGILEGDDKDGYYKIRIGEIINGRYQIQATLGRGMFSGVARAVDVTTKGLVAVKIMRNNDALRKGGYTEIAILQKLNDADPENRRHIVKFERYFDHRGHLCMAFENLSMNLREVLRKFGNNVGINLTATKAYAYQIFVALAHMRKCSIIHADLKPDNILVNESRNVLKICDLGTAIDRSDAATAHTEITPYLVSRFYRAPEIILGIPYDYGVDMWSIGCTLYELYTGKILFAGDSNNQMLKAIMEIRGRFTPKLFKRGQLSANHFDEMGQFFSIERDKVLGKTAVRALSLVKPTRDLRTRLMAGSSGMSDTEIRELSQFVDLLEHCLALNPDKRLKPAEALRHPFFMAKPGLDRR